MKIQSIGFRALTIGLCLIGLAACGNTVGDRALSGGAIGATTGAGVGAVVGGIGIVPAAVVGGVVGAGIGVVTTPDQVNLGKPVWRQ